MNEWFISAILLPKEIKCFTVDFYHIPELGGKRQNGISPVYSNEAVQFKQFGLFKNE